MDLRGVSPQEGERCALTVVLADTLAVFRAYQPVYRQAVVSAVVRAFKGSGHTPYYIMVDGEGQDEATICTTCVPHGNPNLDGLLSLPATAVRSSTGGMRRKRRNVCNIHRKRCKRSSRSCRRWCWTAQRSGSQRIVRKANGCMRAKRVLEYPPKKEAE